MKPSIATVSPSRTSSATASRIVATLPGISLLAGAPLVESCARAARLLPSAESSLDTRRARPLTSSTSSARWRGDVGDRLGEDPDRGRGLGLGHDQRRRHPHAVVAGLEDQQAPPEGLHLDRLGGLAGVELDADHQALAADVVDEAREAVDERPQAGQGLVAAAPAFAMRPPSRRAIVSIIAASATGLPPYVEPWVPGPQFITSARAIIAPIGMPEAMPLAVRRMSGSTPQCSIAHIFPVRPGARLDLVGDEQDPVPVAELAQARQEAGLGDDVAALALDRLDDDRGELVGGHQLLKTRSSISSMPSLPKGTW